MLSSEDSRRLAQLERQLLRDDPDFCARMTAGQPAAAGHRRPPLALIFTTMVLCLTAVVCGVLTWWPPAILAALAATMTAAVLAHRLLRARRPHT